MFVGYGLVFTCVFSRFKSGEVGPVDNRVADAMKQTTVELPDELLLPGFSASSSSRPLYLSACHGLQHVWTILFWFFLPAWILLFAFWFMLPCVLSSRALLRTWAVLIRLPRHGQDHRHHQGFLPLSVLWILLVYPSMQCEEFWSLLKIPGLKLSLTHPFPGNQNIYTSNNSIICFNPALNINSKWEALMHSRDGLFQP